MTTALIDADIVAYRCAASAEKEEASIAMMRTDLLMQEIISATGSTGYKAYLSGYGEDNFRRKVDPQYKANRVDVVKPIHLAACQEFLVTHWKAETVRGYEADDAMGMSQTAETVICSIDKDMLQVPGYHYNFVKKEFKQVTEDEGLKAFYTQTLVGDRADNVFGVAGIGPVKAAKLLDSLLPQEYYKACLTLYLDDKERLHSNCKLLWIWRSPGDVWEPPVDPVAARMEEILNDQAG
tara:strand:- start:423 stop:1136 length:714 start_codon:yes stop_codon:yes gene_type:complete